jgi:hypothetical protein
VGIDEDEGADVGEAFFFPVDAEVADALLIVRDIDDGELERCPHLRRGESDAMGIIHRLNHVGGKGPHFVGHGLDTGADLAKNGSGIEDDVSDHGIR